MELTAGPVPMLLLAVGVALLVVVIGFFSLKLGNRAQHESIAGLQALGALKWREFANLLLQLFRERGFVPAENDHRKPGDGGFDLLLTRGSARYLVQAKHGATYHVNAADVGEFLSVMRTHGAEGGIIVTTGHFDDEARQAARGNNLDLLDGDELWQELQPFLPEPVRAETREGASHARGRQVRRLATIAVVVGTLAFGAAWLLTRPLPLLHQDAASAVPLADATAPYETLPATDTAPVGPIDPVPVMPVRAPDLSDGDLATRRGIAAEGVRAVDGVDSAEWSTKSTLVVALRGGTAERRDEIVAAICEELVAFDEMRYTRVQLHDFEAKTEADARVRWLQCQ